MSNFDNFKETVEAYLAVNGIELSFLSTLREVSLNDTGKRYLYNGEDDYEVVSMDALAKYGYRVIKSTLQENPITTADAFLINKNNEWYLIEFKDQPIKGEKKSTKDNIIKKAYENWYMILNIFYTMAESGKGREIFDTADPVKFAKSHVYYILVCSADKNANIYNQVKNRALLDQNYTPPFMQRLKDYIFKDAFVYTEDYFERKFVKSFVY